MPTATNMAVEHASELASIVASYLRKHGFAKTLSAFLRENVDAFQETDVVDLETLYKLYISTQANGPFKAKEFKPVTSNKEAGDDGEKASASHHTNGGTSSEKKKKKKGDKKNATVDLPEFDQTGKSAAEAKTTINEEGSKKKKGRKNLEGSNTNIEGLKSECEKFPVRDNLKEAFSNGNALRDDSTFKENDVENHDVDGGCLAAQQELAHSRKSSIKKSKKEKKEQGGVLLQGSETLVAIETRPADNAQVMSLDGDMPKKKRKKSKDSGSKEETDDAALVKSASKVAISEHTEKLDASKQPVEALTELEGGESSAKKKKHRKVLSSQGIEDGSKEPAESKLEENKNDVTDGTKLSGKKRKMKVDATVGKNSIQDSNLGSPPEKLKEVEGISDKDVEMQELGSAKTKRKQETSSDKKTPTGALAFKRVEVEKVTFSDPRLSDNSYWAKDGADEGYGAKAQEVLGLVRGRDFRHEKTKKKRGSYRGGLIGLQSHSIKFDDSDEE